MDILIPGKFCWPLDSYDECSVLFSQAIREFREAHFIAFLLSKCKLICNKTLSGAFSDPNSIFGSLCLQVTLVSCERLYQNPFPYRFLWGYILGFSFSLLLVGGDKLAVLFGMQSCPIAKHCSVYGERHHLTTRSELQKLENHQVAAKS